MKVLITSGGMHVPIDSVRSLTNFSSGRFGCELAEAFAQFGHEVTMFAQTGSKTPPGVWPQNGVRVANYLTYDDYTGVCPFILAEQPDLILSAAAVSDYTVDPVHGKISTAGEIELTLRPTEKLLGNFRSCAPNAKIVGFKLLVSPRYEEVYKAVNKQLQSGVDHVVYNDLTEMRKGNLKRLLFSKDMSWTAFTGAEELVKILVS